MNIFQDCHETLPKFLLKWWLSLEIMIKDCHQSLPKVLLKWWLSLIAKNSAEVIPVFMIIIKDCWTFCWNDACFKRLLMKDYWKFCWSDGSLNIGKKKLQKKDCSSKSSEKLIKYILSVWGTGIAPAHLASLSLFCTWRTFKIGVKWKFLTWPSDPFVTSDVSDAQNWGKMQIFAPARATLS